MIHLFCTIFLLITKWEILKISRYLQISFKGSSALAIKIYYILYFKNGSHTIIGNAHYSGWTQDNQSNLSEHVWFHHVHVNVGIIHYRFLRSGQIITTDRYREQLQTTKEKLLVTQPRLPAVLPRMTLILYFTIDSHYIRIRGTAIVSNTRSHRTLFQRLSTIIAFCFFGLKRFLVRKKIDFNEAVRLQRFYW